MATIKTDLKSVWEGWKNRNNGNGYLNSMNSGLNPYSGFTNPENPYDKDSKYYSLYQNNPYAQSYYQNTWWDSVGDLIGFTTNQDKYEQNRLTERDAWNARIAELKESDEYESAQAQAQREREAGINPLLAGASPVSSGESNGMPQNPPISADLSVITPSDCIQSVCNIMTSVMGFTERLQNMKLMKTNIKGAELDNIGKSIDNENSLIRGADSFRETSRKYVMDELLSLPIKSVDSGKGTVLLDDGNEIEISNIDTSKILSGARSPYDTDALNKKYARYREKVVKTPGFQAEFIKAYNDMLKGKVTTQEVMTSPFFINGFDGDDDFRVQSVLSEYCQNMLKLQKKYSVSSEANKAKNEDDYQSTYNGGLAAQADNSGNSASIEVNKRSEGINKMWNATIQETEKLVSKLSKLANSNGKGFMKVAEQKAASLALISTFGLLSTMQSGFHPNFSRHQSYINNNTNQDIQKAVTINNPLPQ